MNLSELIETHRGGRTYADLARDAGGAPSGERIRQMLNMPMKNFPDPPSVRGLAKALKVSQGTVVLAAAESLGLDVRQPSSRLAQLLPASAADLTEVQAAAIAHVVSVLAPNDLPSEQWVARVAPKVAEPGLLAEAMGLMLELQQQYQQTAAEDQLFSNFRSALENPGSFVAWARDDAHAELSALNSGGLRAAARKGTPNLRSVKKQQDEAGEAPDPEGPEGGA